LSQSDQDFFGAADIAKPIDVLVLNHFANELRAAPAQPRERVVNVLHGEHHSQVAQSVHRGAAVVGSHGGYEETRQLKAAEGGRQDTQTVVHALVRHARKLPKELYRSLTWDRGKELAAHKRFTPATDIKVYFCDPQSPWKRGSNENTNGLLRQYLPKGLDISGYSQASLDTIARKLNERPRKTLGYKTPADMFSECVASTG
jgi:IS30 family transposase